MLTKSQRSSDIEKEEKKSIMATVMATTTNDAYWPAAKFRLEKVNRRAAALFLDAAHARPVHTRV